MGRVVLREDSVGRRHVSGTRLSLALTWAIGTGDSGLSCFPDGQRLVLAGALITTHTHSTWGMGHVVDMRMSCASVKGLERGFKTGCPADWIGCNANGMGWGRWFRGFARYLARIKRAYSRSARESCDWLAGPNKAGKASRVDCRKVCWHW
ncbi:hypothetical protein LZ30DRAFT_352581 [Colletotrichum cereale]|nr:hypothetical protein LZ30DRAFT_352581 [Colletotrichum cereale]